MGHIAFTALGIILAVVVLYLGLTSDEFRMMVWQARDFLRRVYEKRKKIAMVVKRIVVFFKR